MSSTMQLADFIAEGDQSAQGILQTLPSGKVAAVFDAEERSFAVSNLPRQTIKESFLSREDRQVLNRELLVKGISEYHEGLSGASSQEIPTPQVQFSMVTPKNDVLTFKMPFEDLFEVIHSFDQNYSPLAKKSSRRTELENASPEEMSELLGKVDFGAKFAERCARFSPITAESERGHLHVLDKETAKAESFEISGKSHDSDNEDFLLCDFHNHTTWSDGKLSMKEVVDMYGERGFDAICITDHLVNPGCFMGKIVAASGLVLTPAKLPDYLAEIEEMKVYAKEKYGMILMAGVEVNKDSLIPSRATHLLCIDLKGPIDPSKSTAEIADQVHEMGGVTIVAHPDYFKHILEGLRVTGEFHTRRQLKDIDSTRFIHDAWEVGNSNYVFPEVAKKVEELGLTGLADADFHKPAVHSQTFHTVLLAERTEEGIKDTIRNHPENIFLVNDRNPDQLYRPEDLKGVTGKTYSFEELNAQQAANRAKAEGQIPAPEKIVKGKKLAMPEDSPKEESPAVRH